MLARHARLFLVYGLFSVLCLLSLLWLHMLTEPPSVSLAVVAHRYVPLLEYPLMSLALTLGGGLLLDRAERQ